MSPDPRHTRELHPFAPAAVTGVSDAQLARRREQLLVSADQLARELSEQSAPHVLDLRYDPAQKLADEGYAAYRSAHVPQAVYVELRTELADPSDGPRGRRPLPSRQRIQRAAQRWGLQPGRRVVVYDDRSGLVAARAWWVLRWAGLANVRLLDGGFSAWRAAGYPVATGDETPLPSDIVLDTGHEAHLDTAPAARLAALGRLLDARPREVFAGGGSEQRRGHIPGAISLPTAENLDEDGRFLPSDSLRKQFLAAGLQPDEVYGVYCGGGVTAAHTVLAMELAGLRGVLYPASWSGWSADPQRPAAVATS